MPFYTPSIFCQCDSNTVRSALAGSWIAEEFRPIAFAAPRKFYF